MAGRPIRSICAPIFGAGGIIVPPVPPPELAELVVALTLLETLVELAAAPPWPGATS